MRIAEADEAGALRIARHPALERDLRISSTARWDGRIVQASPWSLRFSGGREAWQTGGEGRSGAEGWICVVDREDPRH